MSWHAQTNSYYDARAAKWRYAEDHLTGEVLDKLDTYLIHHSQGELEAAYRERQKIADYTPYYAFAVNSLAGSLFTAEAEAARTWTREDAAPILGDPSDADSIMRRLRDDADGQGGNYMTVWRRLAPRLIALLDYWVLVEGRQERPADPEDPEGPAEVVQEATVRLIRPLDVLDWTTRDGRLTSVKVRHEAERPRSIEEAPEVATYYTVYRLDGWTRYRETTAEDAAAVTEVDSGTYAYYATRRRRQRIIPMRRFGLPFDTQLGYLMARKANAMFNLESSRDFLLWTANFIRLRIQNSDWTDEEIQRKLREGWTYFMADALEYVNPSSEPAENASRTLERKQKDFETVFFRAYADAAREKTATEIRQDAQSGIEAFLVMLKTTIDEAERFCLWIWEQVYAPERPEDWRQATVTRSNTFAPIDYDALATNMKERYLPEAVPAGKTALVNVVQKLLDLDGVGYDRDEVEQAVDEYLEAPAEDGGAVTQREARTIARIRERIEARQGRAA
ncbi:MAG: hypothetical protein GVY18_04510 [Bacteroidetes bacterium]|jgi:hypothetical protein|nr:hypothetical protein [Bacteroidota bacterium]